MGICSKHKLIKILFILFVFFKSAYAYDAYVIENSSTLNAVNLSSYIYFTKDHNNTLVANSILNSKNLKQAPINGQIKNLSGPFWTKLEIKNGTTDTKNIVFYNLLPGINYIDVYIYKNNKLLKKYMLGDMREQSSRQFKNRHSMFELLVASDESYTIISKVDNYNINNISWVISKHSDFINAESNKILIYGLISGFLVLFSILNFLLFSVYKSTPYLMIGLNTIVHSAYYFTVQGLFYQLGIGINIKFLTLYAWIAPNISSILFLIFVITYFELQKNYKKIFYVSLFLIFLHLIIIGLMNYAFFINESYFKYSFLIGSSSIVNVLFLLFVGIYIKEIGSKFFLFGQLILAISILMTTLSIYGVIVYHGVYRDIVNIAFVIDVNLLLIAQYLKTKHHTLMLNNSKNTLIEYSRFNSIGTAINNITHQWKYPLVHIGSSITLLETILKHKKELLASHVESEIPKMSYSLELMKNTIDEFSKYYSKKIEKNFFNIKILIDNIENILKVKLISKNTTLTTNLKSINYIYGYEHIYSNIIMVLIDNSLDAFDSEFSSNKITISVHKQNSNLVLVYKDNAGGIKIDPIHKIFDHFISSKSNNDNKGVGLAIVKILIEDRLNGSISVQNRDNGAEFKITIGLSPMSLPSDLENNEKLIK